jgi:acetoin utilization protein AcuC
VTDPVPTTLVWADTLAGYRFSATHPLNPRRLELTVALLRALRLLEGPGRRVVEPRAATLAELHTVHDEAYVAAVRRLSEPGADPGEGLRWGLGTEDNPVVPGLHAMASVAAGSTLVAAQEVMAGRARRAFSVAGGLHHAHRDRASGFCVYSDLAVAIEWLRQEHGARVLYIDVDAHHGDGVQQIFWQVPEVLTVSFHESGVFLFPGTGYVDEHGGGDGYGYAVNVPLDPDTDDSSFIRLYDELMPELAAAFRPDAIVLQCGCDSHWLDPLTHLRCTTRLLEHLVRTTCVIAEQECAGRVIATGGGGYAIHDVVPRAWTLVWGALCGETLSDGMPVEWLDAVRAELGRDVPATLRDPVGAVPPSARRAEMEQNNLRTLEMVRRDALPLLTGWSLGF